MDKCKSHTTILDNENSQPNLKPRTRRQRDHFRETLAHVLTDSHREAMCEFLNECDPDLMMCKTHRDLYFYLERIVSITGGLREAYFRHTPLQGDLKRMKSQSMIIVPELPTKQVFGELDVAIEKALILLQHAQASLIEQISEEGLTTTTIAPRGI